MAGRGRPKSDKPALTNAERQRQYKERLKEQLSLVTENNNVVSLFPDSVSSFSFSFFLISKGFWVFNTDYISFTIYLFLSGDYSLKAEFYLKDGSRCVQSYPVDNYQHATQLASSVYQFLSLHYKDRMRLIDLENTAFNDVNTAFSDLKVV